MTLPIIFGCGRASGGFEKKSTIRLLRRAQDLGFSGFDIAPMYGHGQVEDILYEAFGSEIKSISISTKAGLNRAAPQGFIKSAIKHIARPLYSSVHAKLISKKQRIVVADGVVGRMDVKYIKESFFDSLKRLRVERIDTFMLHEPRNETMTDEVILFLEHIKKQGYVSHFGTGTSHYIDNAVKVGEVCQCGYESNYDYLMRTDIAELRLHGLFRAYSKDEVMPFIRQIVNRDKNVYPKIQVVYSTKSLTKLNTLITDVMKY